MVSFMQYIPAKLNCSYKFEFHRLQSGPSTRNQPHLVITTYGLLPSFVEGASSTEYGWDYMVLDEAQKIKNSKTQAAINTRRIAEFGKKTRRLILTGTPIMNNLSELWSLMDFACAGRVLGSESRYVLMNEGMIYSTYDILSI